MPDYAKRENLISGDGSFVLTENCYIGANLRAKVGVSASCAINGIAIFFADIQTTDATSINYPPVFAKKGDKIVLSGSGIVYKFPARRFV